MNRSRSFVLRHASFAVIAAAILPVMSGRCFAAGGSAGQGGEQSPGDAVSVTVASGRTFVGEIDPQTDRNQLWLRMGEGAIVLRRPIDWDRVVRVRQGEKELTADEVRGLAAGSQLPAPNPPIPPPPAPAEELNGGNVSPSAPAARAAAVALPAVASLQIDAELGHWTPDVPASGIVVCIHPTSADGGLAPVDGTLIVELIAQQPASQGEGDGLETIGRWTQAVNRRDFGPLGADYRFAFQAVHPDFDFNLRAHALVHARLIVPGQGTFEASDAMTRIRAYSSVRDRLQQHTGSRFAPLEETDH